MEFLMACQAFLMKDLDCDTYLSEICFATGNFVSIVVSILAVMQETGVWFPAWGIFGSWDDIVGLATGYRLDNWGVRVWDLVRSGIFSTSSRPALGITQPPIQWVPGALSPRVKRLGHEADHSLPASAEVKKMWIYTSTPPYAFMA
jgi:hypothetical protein